MPRYEYDDGKSKKFWEIHRDGDTFTVRFGRLGTGGQTSTKVFASEDKAKKKADSLVASKVKKGYVLVGDAAAAAPEPEPDRNPQLEAAFYQNPDDPAAWTAYGEWLDSIGDARGELIELSLQDGGMFAKKRRDKRIDEITREHQGAWMGPELAKIHQRAEKEGWEGFDETLKLEWRHGFIDRLRVATWYDWQGPAPIEMLRVVLRSPASRFLRKLVIGNLLGDSGESDYSRCVLAISKAGKLPSLRHVHIGDFEQEECEISWAEVGDVSKLYPVAPNLETLRVRGAGIALGRLQHARLRRLVLETGGLPAKAARSVAAADLPELVELEVWLGDENYGAEATTDMFAPILAGDRFPKLKALGLKNGEIMNDLALALVDSPVLSRIESLDLSMGTMNDEGAQTLLDHAGKLKHLKSLDLSDNFIGDAVAKALRQALGDAVNVSGQDEADEYDGELEYYVSVGE